MKFFVKIVALFVCIAMIVPCVASCGSLDGNKAIKKMDSLIKSSKSYYTNGKISEITQVFEIAGTAYEVPVHTKQEITGTITYIDSDAENMIYIEDLNVKLTDIESSASGDTDTIESIKEYSTIGGYFDQNIIYSYIPSEADENASALRKRSQCTEDEYKELLEIDKSLSPQIKSEYIEEINITKNRSKKIWSVSISSLNANGERAFQNWIDYSMMTSGLSFELSKIEAELEIDTKTKAIKSSYVNIKAVSTVEDLTLTITLKDTYSLPNQENNIAIDLEEYQDNADLKAFMYSQFGLVKLIMLNTVSRFYFSTASIITQDSKAILNSSEKDNVRIDADDTNLSYKIDSNLEYSNLEYNNSSVYFTISYDGKKQTMESEGAAPEVNPQTKAEAKAYLATSFFKLFSFDATTVKNINTQAKNNNTVVSLIIDNPMFIEQILASVGLSGIKTTKEHYTIDITISNETNQLISVSTEITAYMTVQSSKISVIIDSSLIINTDNTAETI